MAEKRSEIRKFKKSLSDRKVAFLIGNGINRFPHNPKGRSWDDLLKAIVTDFSDLRRQNLTGISLIELYDIIELYSTGKTPKKKIKHEISEKMNNWKSSKSHKDIINIISKSQSPILTTNFDDLLEQAIDAQKFIIKNPHKNFTDYYPWECYFAPNEISDILNNFAIWHIHGTRYYPRSIRFGLADYMGMVEKARTFIRGKNGLGKNQNLQNWRGFNTWLNVFFNKSLFIFGLGLDQNEVFLRWMLIERKRYFMMNPNRQKEGWYIFIKEFNPVDQGKIFFLKQMGINVISFDTKEEFYINFWDSLTKIIN
jgi:hypothetical protein